MTRRGAQAWRSALIVAGLVAASFGVVGALEAYTVCHTSHFTDGTCRTTCIFYSETDQPQGYMSCNCCG